MALPFLPQRPIIVSVNWREQRIAAIRPFLGAFLDDLAQRYRGYLACLNARDWEQLGRFVAADVRRNGELFGVAGYRAMLEKDVSEIPDLVFRIELMAVDPPFVAARLGFDCTPRGKFLGLPVDGRRIVFSENVFYKFREGEIVEVWSVVDKAAIEAQLR